MTRLAPLVGLDPPEDLHSDYWEAALALARGFREEGLDPGDGWLPYELAAFEAEGLLPPGTAPAEFDVPETEDEFAEMHLAERPRDLAEQVDELVVAALREYLDFDPKEHPKWPKGTPGGKGGKFKPKLAALKALADKLLDGKARAKELAKRTYIDAYPSQLEIPPQTEPRLREPRMRARKEAVEKEARKVLAKDKGLQRLLTDPNLRTDGTNTVVTKAGPDAKPESWWVDIPITKPEGWEIATTSDVGETAFYDPEMVVAIPKYPTGEHPFGTSSGEVSLRVRSQFDPEQKGPLMERWMTGNEVEDYTQLFTNDAFTQVKPLTETEFERLRAGEAIEVDNDETGWGFVHSQLRSAPIEERSRPQPAKHGGLDKPGYVIAYRRTYDSRVQDITAADVAVVIEAKPVVVKAKLRYQGRTPDPNPDDANFATYTEMWSYRPVADPGDEFTSLATGQGGRGANAIFATTMLNRERRARADAVARDKGYTGHGSMKELAMERVAAGIDLHDPDVQAFKRVADIIIDTEESAHGGTPEQKMAASIISSWARSSSNEHTWGHYMQWVAAREFGLPLNDWVGGLRFKQEAPGMWASYQYLIDPIGDDDEDMDQIREMMSSPAGFHFGEAFGYDLLTIPPSDIEQAERGARKVLRGMYNATQADLDSLGQDEFLLWRGMSRIEETKEIGLIKMYNPEVVSASPNAGGGFEVSMRRAATAEEAAMFAGSFPEGATLPIPLDSEDRNKGFYWPPWDKSKATSPEALEHAMETLPVGEHGMIDRRVAIARHHAREIAGLGGSIGEVSTSPVIFYAGDSIPEYLREEGKKAAATLRWAPKGDSPRPERDIEIPYGIARMISQARDREMSALRNPADPAQNTFAALDSLIGHEYLDADGKTKRIWMQHDFDIAKATLEDLGWDVSPGGGRKQIDTALSDPDLVVPWMLDHGMLEPVELKRTVVPGWLQGGLHVADDVRANPMSSHATSYGATSNFTGEGGGRIAGIVAKEDIIGMPGAGYGCLEEDEVVVLGRPRRYVVVPYGTELPDDQEVVDLIETGKVKPPPPDVPQTVSELPTEIPTQFLNKPEADAFVWSYYDHDTGNTVTVDLLPLAYWIDQEAFKADEDGLDLTVLPGNVVHNDNTGERVHLDPGGDYELTAEDLRDALARAWEIADNNQTASGWDTVTVREAPEGYEPDADLAWHNLVAATMAFTDADKPHAEQLAQVLMGIIGEEDPNATFTLVADMNAGNVANIVEHDATGNTYEFPGLDIPNQDALDSVVKEVKGFFAPAEVIDPAEEYDIAEFLKKVDTHATGSTGPVADFVNIMAGLISGFAGQNKFTLWSSGSPSGHPGAPAIVKNQESGQQYEFPGLYIPGGQPALDKALQIIGAKLGFVYEPEPPVLDEPQPEFPWTSYAEAKPLATYIFIDGPENADWPKMTWDFWDVDTPAKLDAELAQHHESPEHFMTLPVFQLNVEKLPWLKTWAQWHGREYAHWDPQLHPRWPKGMRFGGRFRGLGGGGGRPDRRGGAGAPSGYVERYREAAAALDAANKERNEVFERVKKREYARLRAEDKAAGRDTGGRSVQTRNMLAHSAAMEDPEYRALRDRVEAARQALEEIKRGPSGGLPASATGIRRGDVFFDKEEGGRVRVTKVSKGRVYFGPEDKTFATGFLTEEAFMERMAPIGGTPLPPEEPLPGGEGGYVEAARELLAKPKLKLPGYNDLRVGREARKAVAEERRPHYNAAAARVGAELETIAKELNPGEYLLVHGRVRYPIEENENDMAYLYVPGRGWTYAQNVRWRRVEAAAHPQLEGLGGPGLDQLSGKYELWAETGPSLQDRKVDLTGDFSFEPMGLGSNAQIVTGGLMSNHDSLMLYTPEDAGRTKSKETKQREHDMLERVREAGGDWLGYGDIVTEDDVRAYLGNFEPGTTLGRDPHWPDSDDMWVRGNEGGWDIYASRAPVNEWGWEETPSRHLSDDEAYAEAGEAIRRHLARMERAEEAHAFKEEVEARVAMAGPKEPARLENGAPGAQYVAQHKEIVRVGKLLDAEVQRRYAEKTKGMPDVALLEKAEDDADHELALERQRVRDENGSRLYDMLADEVMLQTGRDREQSEALVSMGWVKQYGSYTVMKDWRIDDWIANRGWQKDRLGENVLVNDGDALSEYALQNVFRNVLLADAGFYDLDEQQRVAWLEEHGGWYGPHWEKAKEIVAKKSGSWEQQLTHGALAQRRQEADTAREQRKVGQSIGPTAYRDAALEVLREVREIGGGKHPTYWSTTKKPARVVAEEAYDLYPRDWQDRLGDTPPPLYIAMTSRRGHFSRRGGPSGSDKIWASPGSGGLPDQGGKERWRFDTVVHELGHRFEAYMPEISAAEWTFWHYLARDRDPSFDFTKDAESIQSLNRIRRAQGKPKLGYKSSEVGIADRMEEEYALKVYGGGGPDKYWELLTMGYEDLTTGGKMLAKDEEYRQWLLGLMASI